jgi:hypothetical protein
VIKLEVGKAYRTRDGRKAEVVTRYDVSDCYQVRLGGLTWGYIGDGRVHLGPGEHKEDIVAAWVEPVKRPHIAEAESRVVRARIDLISAEEALVEARRRQTGRTTQQAVAAIAEALRCPGFDFKIEDHAARGCQSSEPSRLQWLLIQRMVSDLGLEGFRFTRGSLGSYQIQYALPEDLK